MNDQPSSEQIKNTVRETYGGLARRFVEEPSTSCCGPRKAETRAADSEQSCCCGRTEEPVGAAAQLYPADELVSLPDSVTGASAGCGNPTAIAELKPGEVVLDLGSGGGIDCFLAAQKVGPQGRVIGLDMTPEMIKLARRNAKKLGATNVEFNYGEIEEIPLPDATVDVIISNCVINLSPDKDAVFAEAYRVLRPGGRMSISDIVFLGQVPPEIRGKLDAWAGCIAGALPEEEYLGKIRAAGFVDVEVESRVTGGESPEGKKGKVVLIQDDGRPVEDEELEAQLAAAGLSIDDVAQKIASIRVRARKGG